MAYTVSSHSIAREHAADMAIIQGQAIKRIEDIVSHPSEKRIAYEQHGKNVVRLVREQAKNR